MKRVRINGQEYTAETAVALINEVKGMHWRAGENATIVRATSHRFS